KLQNRGAAWITPCPSSPDKAPDPRAGRGSARPGEPPPPGARRALASFRHARRFASSWRCPRKLALFCFGGPGLGLFHPFLSGEPRGELAALPWTLARLSGSPPGRLARLAAFPGGLSPRGRPRCRRGLAPEGPCRVRLARGPGTSRIPAPP